MSDGMGEKKNSCLVSWTDFWLERLSCVDTTLFRHNRTSTAAQTMPTLALADKLRAMRRTLPPIAFLRATLLPNMVFPSRKGTLEFIPKRL